MRLVLDTDVVLSGLRSTVGASRVSLLAVQAGVVIPTAKTPDSRGAWIPITVLI